MPAGCTKDAVPSARASGLWGWCQTREGEGRGQRQAGRGKKGGLRGGGSATTRHTPPPPEPCQGLVLLPRRRCSTGADWAPPAPPPPLLAELSLALPSSAQPSGSRGGGSCPTALVGDWFWAPGEAPPFPSEGFCKWIKVLKAGALAAIL